MPDFWLDSNTFITAKNTAYGFDIAPGFWEFLDQKAKEGIIASSTLVYHELIDEGTDDLADWARHREHSGLFVEPDASVQTQFQKIADYVNASYPAHHARDFLADADPWLIAHAKVYGGSVVTFEKGSGSTSGKVKIPDVADYFGVKSNDLWDSLRQLGASFVLLDAKG